MDELRLPFWLVTDRTEVMPPAAFTTSVTLKTFLDTREAGRWQLSLIPDEESLMLAVADIHSHGIEVVCVDPKPDASKSDSVKLIDLMELAREIRPAKPAWRGAKSGERGY